MNLGELNIKNILILLFFSYSSLYANNDSNKTIIYYGDFDSSTTLPVTIKNIESTKCKIELNLQETNFIERLFTTKKRVWFRFFNRKGIRLKVINLFGKTIYMDISRIIKKNNISLVSPSYMMNKYNLVELEAFLNEKCGWLWNRQLKN